MAPDAAWPRPDGLRHEQRESYSRPHSHDEKAGTSPRDGSVTATLSSVAPDREALRRARGPAVSARAVTKTFRLPHEKYTTVRQRILRPARSRSYEVMDALRGVSFDVAE